MVKIVHISIFNRLLNFIAHKTYYEELQNNYKTIIKVKKTDHFGSSVPGHGCSRY